MISIRFFALYTILEKIKNNMEAAGESIMKILFTLFIPLLFLGGCGNRNFTPRTDNPVTEDYIGGAFTGATSWGIASSTAARRTAYMRLGGDVGKKGELCAEPPPDVMEAIASFLIAAARADVSGPQSEAAETSTGTVNAAAEYSRFFASEVASILKRSQGLQFSRDQNASLCVDYLNRVINEHNYLAEKRRIRETATDLILAEIAAGTITPPLQQTPQTDNQQAEHSTPRGTIAVDLTALTTALTALQSAVNAARLRVNSEDQPSTETQE